MSEQETATAQHAKALGLERWLQLAFAGFALLCLWILDRTITLVWDRFAEPPPTVVTLLAAVIALTLTMVLYRHERVNRVAREVVGELAQVTWPSREETRVSTVVVIIASIIASIIIGIFDATWSWITDFIYKV